MKIPAVEFSPAVAAKMSLPVVNDSGMIPVEYRCVVRLDPVEEVTAGGIIKPQMRAAMDQMAATEAVLLAVGGNAFSDWADPVPQVGDKVMINKYAGQFREANPEDRDRLIQDKDILAVLK
jgi:co-chaperonin GroES (HSP10)